MQHFHFRKGQKQPLAYVYGRLSVSTFALFFRHVFSKWLWRGPRRGVMRAAEGYGKVGRWIWAAGMGDEYGRWRRFRLGWFRFRHGWRRFHFRAETCATRLGWKAEKRCRFRPCFGTCAAQAGTCAVHTGTCAARAGTCAVHTGTCTARRPLAAPPPPLPLLPKWQENGGRTGEGRRAWEWLYFCLYL